MALNDDDEAEEEEDSCDGMMSYADISCGQARWCVRQAHKEHESNQAEHVLMVDKGVN